MIVTEKRDVEKMSSAGKKKGAKSMASSSTFGKSQRVGNS